MNILPLLASLQPSVLLVLIVCISVLLGLFLLLTAFVPPTTERLISFLHALKNLYNDKSPPPRSAHARNHLRK